MRLLNTNNTHSGTLTIDFRWPFTKLESIKEAIQDECECCQHEHGFSSFMPRVYCKLCGHPYVKKDGSPMYCIWPEKHPANFE